jgi:hypothetical protein
MIIGGACECSAGLGTPLWTKQSLSPLSGLPNLDGSEGLAMTDLDPVIVGEPLWTLQKDGHSAEARVRAIPGIGLELRFSIDGELYSHRFTAWEPLEQAAQEKKADFETRGWRA